MLDSIPGPFQAIIWPLLGAAIVLTMGRLLPNWLRRLVAVASAVTTLAVLWPLIGAERAQIEFFWEPVNLFRMSPVFQADGLALFTALTLGAFTVAAALGIRGAVPQRTAWHGLVLVSLSGCLAMAFAANMLALAIASALVDLALVAAAASTTSEEPGAHRSAWRMVGPGIASTLLLLAGALWMDSQVGHASLAGRELPVEVLALIGVAGLLRLAVYPLFPSAIGNPESAAGMVLPLGAGVYLLARVQSLALVLPDQPWVPVLGGVALLAGGLLAWTHSFAAQSRHSEVGGKARPAWPSLAIHQTGYAILFVVFVDPSIPWPLPSLVFALGALAIWWDGNSDAPEQAGKGWLAGTRQNLKSRWDRALLVLSERVSMLGRWRESWAGQHLRALLPAVALASLAGIPLTLGALGRWSMYAALLSGEAGALLLVALIADTLLVAGLWTGLRRALAQPDSKKTAVGARVAMTLLAVLIVAIAVSPDTVTAGLDLETARRPEVSAWGLGLLYVLPWLAGSWLARSSGHLSRILAAVWQVTSLDWFYQAVGWVGQRLAGAVHWVGLVGEGEGWWGWALIILSLGVLFLTAA